MIALPLYAKIKDRYCIGYFGESKETLTDLIKARPIIEKEMPGLQLYICCNDEKVNALDSEERIIPKSQLETRSKDFAYFREINNETVIDLLEESQIPYDPKLFKK